MVLVDSSVWINYLREPTSLLGLELQTLIDRNQVIMVGVVFAEVLQGARGEAEYAQLAPHLDRVPYVEADKGTWMSAGAISMHLRAGGQATPLTDLVIAALALEGGHQVFSLDGHFRRIPGLRLYEPLGRVN